MSFSRQLTPLAFSTGNHLTSDMISIGMLFAGTASRDANIEDTLIAASIEGLIKQDGRVMALLTDWISIHHARINADRLTKIVQSLDNKEFESLRIYWCATAERLSSDSRFHKLRSVYSGPKIPYLSLLNPNSSDQGGHNFLLKRNGEDIRFKNTSLIVPNKVIRHRPADILDPASLAKQHRPYRFRIIMGPSYRADLWALLRRNPNLSVVELARQTYASYNTAKEVKDDYELVKQKHSSRTQAA